MFRQRVWCEIVVVIRGASKALLFPYCLMLLGDYFKLPPSVSAFMAFSYLIPWTVENKKLGDSLNNPRVYRRSSGVHRQVGAAADNADCGATMQTPMLPNITESEALTNILAASPDSVYLVNGDVCPVCLEPFSAEAVENVVHGESGMETCKKLRTLH